MSTAHLKAQSSQRTAKRATRAAGKARRATEVAAGTLVPASVFLPYQVAWIIDESVVAFWEKSRRIGADWTEAFRVVRERMNGSRTNDYWYSSADESAAVEFMVYVTMWARDVYGAVLEIATGVEQFDGRDIKVMSVQLPEVNGKRPRITAMASSPKSFRSKGGDVGLSEYAFHAEADKLWQAASPVTMWGGRLRVISSHNGVDSKFNEFLGQARRYTDPETFGQPRKTDIRASIHRTTIHDAVAQGLVERINAVTGESLTREQFLDREQAKCGDPAKWREEYECVPSEESGSYFPFELLRPVATERVVTCRNANAFIASVTGAVGGDEKAGVPAADEVYAGCDVGRKSDLFAVWVDARFGGVLRTVGVYADRDISFGQMESVLVRLLGIEAAGGVRRMAIDSTGLGMQLAERMAERFRYRVEPVNITAAVKEDLVTTARRHFEERTSTLPDDLAVLAEFNSFRKEITTAGNVRYVSDATSEGHADRAFAKFLALHAAKRPAARMRAVPLMGGVVA